MIYSHKWLSAIDNDELYDLAVAEWRERLAGLTGDQITIGLDRLEGEWPPSPHEFKSLCSGVTAHNTKAYLPFKKQKQLEAPKSKSLARKALAKAKRMLKGDRNIDVVNA